VSEGERRIYTEWRAGFDGGELPLARVVRQVQIGKWPHMRQEWVWGPGPRDCLRIVAGFYPHRNRVRIAGHWLHLEGSPAFRAHVDSVLLECLPYRLVPADPRACTEPAPQPEIPEDGEPFLRQLLGDVGCDAELWETLKTVKRAPRFPPEARGGGAYKWSRARESASRAVVKFHRGERGWRQSAESEVRLLASLEAWVDAIDWG
jgi:hypothetical protein